MLRPGCADIPPAAPDETQQAGKSQGFGTGEHLCMDISTNDGAQGWWDQWVFQILIYSE